MILIVLILGVSVAMARFIHRNRCEKARYRLAEQFRASLQNLVFALRSGVSLPQAVEYASREGEFPMANHWKGLCQSLGVGQTLAEALEQFCETLGFREARWFTAAVLVTKSTGGSLADVLETLAESLNEQQALRDKIQALTAQGIASGALLSILPFVVLIAVAVMAPEIARPLVASWSGQVLLVIITALVASGGWVIYKIVTVPVS